MLVVALLFFARPALAAETKVVEAIEYVGLKRVKRSVVEDLLPRPLPAVLDDAEVSELERRLWTLAIFDDVAVVRDGSRLRVTVREKWTLVPTVDFGSSKTLKDSYLVLMLAEYNAFGRAQEVGAYAAYLERALSAEVWTSEPQTIARRPTFEGGAGWVGSGVFFDDSAYAWERRRTGGRLGVRLPFAYGQRLRFAVLSAAYREVLDGDVAPGLGDGTAASLGLRAVWDAYSWNDVAPSGARLSLEAAPGMNVRGDRLLPRHGAFVQALAAIPLSSKVVVAFNVVGEAASSGDPNHSVLLGSVPAYRYSVGTYGGVRGLTDNLYRDTAHAFADVELRGALTLAPRWYLQGALFVDGGTFAQMDAFGRTRPWDAALSTGVGVRLLPTAIATLVPRLDAGRRWLPSEAFFWTFALSQYF